MGVLFKNTLGQQKDNVMEQGRSDAPRGMRFEGILEPLVRNKMENDDAINMLVSSVFDTRKGVEDPCGQCEYLGVWSL